MTICPKCGNQQAGGNECVRCGVIFERYRGTQGAPRRAEPLPTEAPAAPGFLRRAFRIFRWFSLALMVLLVVLILKPAAPPPIVMDPRAKESLQEKLEELRQANRRNKSYSLRLDQAELNTWLDSSLSGREKSEPPSIPGPISSEPALPPNAADPTAQEAQSALRDVKVELLQDKLRAFVRFDFHGKELTLVMQGRVAVDNGYLRLVPDRMKLGSLILPQSMVDLAVSRLFDSPANREKFKLPAEIRDIRVENGELVIEKR